MSTTTLRHVLHLSLSSLFLTLLPLGCESSTSEAGETTKEDDKKSDEQGTDDKTDTSKTDDTTSTTTDNTENTDNTNTTDNTDTGDDKKANTERCEKDDECQSGKCHPFFGICGDCNGDAQCAADGKLNCTRDKDVGTKCSDGALGEFCDSNDGCVDKKCHQEDVEWSDLPWGTCSECVDTKACVDAGTGVNCAQTMGKDWYVCTAGELGDSCTKDEECKDKICHESFGPGSSSGTCSACRDDKSCQDDKKGLNCTARSLAEEDFDGEKDADYYVCSEGKLGETCEAETSCVEELACAIPEGQDVGFCAECAKNSDCMGDNKVCSLVLDANWEGGQTCVDVGTQEANSICTPQEDASKDACKGFCVLLDSMFGDLGACGECRPDHAEEDCGAGKTCEPPVFGQMITGSVCK